MRVPIRLVVTLVRLTGLWAVDTPFEPLLTGLPRANPADSDEVSVEALRSLEMHLLGWATTFFYWIVLGVAGVALALLTLGLLTRIYEITTLGPTMFWIVVVAVVVGFLSWVALFVVFQLRSMKDPAYSFGDRLAVSLKRGSLDAIAERTIEELPDDSILRVYFGPLI